jgi:hypothetical protein
MQKDWIYTGGHKIGNCSHRWLDGTRFNLNFWAAGNPTEGLSENCAIFWLGKIWDLSCYYTREFVCESP